MKMEDIISICSAAFKNLEDLSLTEKVECINKIRLDLKNYSPFKTEPVDCVQWQRIDKVQGNDYNPNSVAPPEMKLLELSIKEDGYTQPVVAFRKNEGFEVVDGFHRSRVAKESSYIRKRIHGFIPLVVINEDREDRSDRMASTIRHNRARGKHNVDSMSDMVVELKRRNRSDKWIAEHLGMDEDEVLRLCQVSGLAEMFCNTQFSKSWDIEIFNDAKEVETIE